MQSNAQKVSAFRRPAVHYLSKTRNAKIQTAAHMNKQEHAQAWAPHPASNHAICAPDQTSYLMPAGRCRLPWGFQRPTPASTGAASNQIVNKEWQ